MIRKEVKDQIIKEYATHEGDTGSPEVQVAVLTYRINELTEHLRTHIHDDCVSKSRIAARHLRKVSQKGAALLSRPFL